MSVPPYHRICFCKPRSIHGSVMSSGQSAFPRRQWISLAGTDILKTTKMCSLRRNSWEEASLSQFFFLRFLKSSSPWETVCAEPLWSVGQTQTKESLATSKWKCNSAHQYRARWGGHCLHKAKVGQHSGSCRPALPRHQHAQESPGSPSFKSRFGFSMSGWAPDSAFLTGCQVMLMRLVLAHTLSHKNLEKIIV